MNFFVHGFNSIMSFFDIVVSKRPSRLLHFYHPLVILLAYTGFTAIYWAAGGRTDTGSSYIYPVTNWENLKLTLPFVVIGLFVVLPIVHFLFWLLHQLRDFCFRSCHKKDLQVESEPSIPRIVIVKSVQEGQLNEAFNDEL